MEFASWIPLKKKKKKKKNQCLQGYKGKFSAFDPIATHTADMGIHPSHQPPTVVSMSTLVSVVGIREADHLKAQVPLTLPNR